MMVEIEAVAVLAIDEGDELVALAGRREAGTARRFVPVYW